MLLSMMWVSSTGKPYADLGADYFDAE
jgi:hypothetical protein